MNIIFNGTSRVSTNYGRQCQKKSVSTKCPDTFLSACNHYCYYLISYYYYLCKYIYTHTYIYNVNKSPVHPSCQALSLSIAFVLGTPVSQELQLFLSTKSETQSNLSKQHPSLLGRMQFNCVALKSTLQHSYMENLTSSPKSAYLQPAEGVAGRTKSNAGQISSE